MKSPWLTSVLPISALFSFRMLGLFMLIPIFTVYANQLTHATPTTIGIALGSYGLSQGLLQIPFGILSDRFGRKPIITVGLILFALGSLVGALSTSIVGMITARTLQGMGAIGSVLIALLADLTSDEQRTKAMAVIGATIGLSFSLAMVLSPALAESFGLSGIFYFTTLLALLGLLLLHTIIPTPDKLPFVLDIKNRRTQLQSVLQNAHLQRLNASIFFQHAILTATFFVIPMLLKRHVIEGHLSEQWHFYLPIMMASFLTMVPFIILAEKRQQMKSIFIGAVVITSICQWILAFAPPTFLVLCGLMFAYFVAFNILEASLPSLVSKQANIHHKGTAMGVYSSSQFLGIFVGGTFAGIVYQHIGSEGVFITNGVLSLLWLGIAYYLKPYAYDMIVTLPYPRNHPNLPAIVKQLLTLPGVKDVTLSDEKQVLYLCVSKADYSFGSAEKWLS